jgi:hypothetical protein
VVSFKWFAVQKSGGRDAAATVKGADAACPFYIRAIRAIRGEYSLAASAPRAARAGFLRNLYPRTASSEIEMDRHSQVQPFLGTRSEGDLMARKSVRDSARGKGVA